MFNGPKDFTKLTSDELRDIARRSGYKGRDSYGMIKYLGFKNGKHCYAFIYEDLNDGDFDIGEMYVFLGKRFIESEFSGNTLGNGPFDTEQEAERALNNIK